MLQRRQSVNVLRPLLLVTAVLASACGGDSSPTAPTPSASPTVQSVALSYTGQLNRPGATAQVTATASLSNGTTENVTATCTGWTSSDAGVVSVSASGLMTAVASGTARISTQCRGVTGAGEISLNLLSRGVADLSTNLTVTFSPEPLYAFRGQANITIRETGGAYGINVNFINVQPRFANGTTAPVRNFNPGEFQRIWGTNHINAGQSNGVTYVIDYNGGGVSALTLDTTTSITDDLGNTQTITRQLQARLQSAVAPLSLLGRDPFGFAVVP